MKRFATYARTSTDSQETGLETQRRALFDYLRYKQAVDHVAFEDEGISGMQLSRPGFDALMKEVRSGSVHTVVVYSYSRFARSTSQLISALDELGKLEVSFVSLTEQIDTGTHIGKLFFRILASLAEFQRDQIAENVKRGLANAKAKGVRLGAFPSAKLQTPMIIELKTQGIHPKEIASKLNISRRSVYRILKAAR